jgi:hypothetical protein
MTPFLKLVAESVYKHHKDNLDKVTLIFPNRRGILFFNKYLAEIIEKPIWLPEIKTISQLIENKSNLVVADNLKIISLLYKHYKSETNTSESFDEFYHWGEMLLSDIDSVDKYQINAEDLFENVENIKDIDFYFDNLGDDEIRTFKEFWAKISLDTSDQYKKSFIQIWKKLFPIYNNLKADLLDKGIGYEGMIYNDIIEKLDIADWDKEKYIFIGFNALNASEIRLFEFLKDNNKAEFYWDYDKHYIDIKEHEAGFFIKDFIKKFDSVEDFSTKSFENNNTNLEIVSVPSAVTQTKYIQQYITEKNFPRNNKTAVLLADENMLVPLLHSMDNEDNSLNITMGYSINFTNASSFFKHYFHMVKTRKFVEEKVYINHKAFVNFLKHKFVYRSEFEEIIKLIAEKNLLYIDKAFIDEQIPEELRFYFNQKLDSKNFINHLTSIINRLYKTVDRLDIEFLHRFEVELNAITNITADITLGLNLLISLLQKRITGLSVAFEAYPMEGVQIMGILESRALDFENVIILSLNEGIFPHVRATPSFIPSTLRTIFKLPTIQYQDSIFAYYFYRVLQRAKNICIMYDAGTSSGKVGEESRYIKQLIYESNFNISRSTLKLDSKIPQIEDISIERTRETQEAVENLAYKIGFSPSMLNTYILCPLKFYYKYIEKIKNEENLLETLDFQFLGNLFHNTAEYIYNDFKNKLNLKEEIEFKLKDKKYIPSKINEALKSLKYNSKHLNSELTNGKILVVKELVEKSIKQLLSIDKNLPNLEIVELEKAFKKKYRVSKIDKEVYVRGFIDRVQKLDGEYVLVDYKTGKFHLDYSSFADLFDSSKETKKDIFQCLLYCLMNNDEYPNSKPAIYGLKDFYKPKFEFMIQPKRGEIDMDEFKLQFEELVENILDKENNFKQTERIANCEFCEYKEVCR